jgi:hypothetical protein
VRLPVVPGHACRHRTGRPPWRSGWRHLVVGQSHRPAIVARNDRAFPGKLSQDLVRVLHAGPSHPGAGPSSTVNSPSISLAIAVIPPRTGRMIFARAMAVPNSAYKMARRTADGRHGVVIAVCCVVPARRYVRMVQPGALTAPSVWRLPRYRRREPAYLHATGDWTYQASTGVTAERVQRARPKARSCPARWPGTVSDRDCQPAAPARLPGTGSYRRSCPRCGASPPGSRPLPWRARLSWSSPGRPRSTGWHEHLAELG